MPATCSSFTPSGRFTGSAFIGGNATLIAPVLGRASTPADFRGFVSPADRFNFAPFNYLQIPLERLGAFANARYEIADDLNFSVKGIWNRRKSKNQAAPLAVRHRADVGPDSGPQRRSSSARTNPFNPFGVDLGGANNNVGAIFRRFVEGGPRRFDQQVDTHYGVATLDGKFDIGGRNWFWDVNAVYGRNKAEQDMFGNINSSKLRQALGPLAGCTAPCVPFNLFGGAGSITPEMINFVTFEQNDSSTQSQVRIDRQHVGQPVRASGRAARARGRRRISQAQGPVRSRSDRRGGLQLRHSGAADARAAMTSRRLMPN